jgi:hypothetical protein
MGNPLIQTAQSERDERIELSSSGSTIPPLSHSANPAMEEPEKQCSKAYGAHPVFFEAGRNDRPPIAQAFVFVSDGPADDPNFAELHKRLWSWGGVPLIYRTTPGLVQLFRCAHKPDFVSAIGEIICKPIKTLKIATVIADRDAWWDASRLRNGTLWDDPAVCKAMLSAGKAAHHRCCRMCVGVTTRDYSEFHDSVMNDGNEIGKSPNVGSGIKSTSRAQAPAVGGINQEGFQPRPAAELTGSSNDLGPPNCSEGILLGREPHPRCRRFRNS